MESFEVTVPMRLGRGGNDRFGNFHAKAAQVKRERAQVGWALSLRFRGCMPGDPSDFRAAVELPVEVTITRVSPSPRPMDTDNLVASAKGVRDEVARWLGVDDGNASAATWRVAQERGPWAVRIAFKSACALGGCDTCREQAQRAPERGGVRRA